MMPRLRWIHACAAWAALGWTAGASAQELGVPARPTLEAFPDVSDTSTVTSLEDRLRDYDQRIKTLEATNAAPQTATKADDGCPPCCCDGLLAKEVPLRSNQVKVGGRIFWDNFWFDQDAAHKAIVGDEENDTGFRLARLLVEGNVWENVEYRFEMDFADSDHAEVADAYLQVVEIPLIHMVRAGHFKEPFSLEELTSINYITFMERSLNYDPFIPQRNEGVMVGGYLGDYENISWWAGVFRSDDPEDPPGIAQDKNDWAYTGRCCWLPYYDEASNGRYLVHLGAGYTYRNYGDGRIPFATQPELGNGSTPGPGNWLDIIVSSFHDQLWNAEAAVVFGPLSLQAEYYHCTADTTIGADKNYQGWYATVSYFLTGEYREYRRDQKVFGRIHPHENAWWVDSLQGWCLGRGAWEVACRWSFLDLQDGGGPAVTGQEGTLEDFTAGVNWYLNPHCRLMFNYIHSNLKLLNGAEGEADMFATRFQVDFP